MAFRIPFDEACWQEYLLGQQSKLPELPSIKSLTGRVIRILGGNPGPMQLQGTNTYLVGTGRSRILIDTGQGFPCWSKRIIGVLEELDVDIAYVLLTHWHGDHTGGVQDLVAYRKHLSSRIYKNTPDRGQRPIADGQIFQVEGATVRAVFTPGHALDHMCFVLEEENALFSGDNVLGHGFSVVQDLGLYVKSLFIMEQRRCAVGYPAHGAVIGDMPRKMKEYINHRMARERKVYATLERRRSELERLGQAGNKGGLTIREIVLRLYGDVNPEMVNKALIPSLLQTLWKLVEDRKVGFEPGEPTERQWFVYSR